jgi:hypothetical protein
MASDRFTLCTESENLTAGFKVKSKKGNIMIVK